LFDDYLAKVVPMVERFGGRYLTKAGCVVYSAGTTDLRRRTRK
jgi:uncharacterized protein (DUF1330 family)